MKKITFLLILTLITTSANADKLLKDGFLDGNMNYSKNQDINDPKINLLLFIFMVKKLMMDHQTTVCGKMG